MTEPVSSHSTDLPPPVALEELATLYKVFGDGTRLRLLHALACSELCVCDLAQMLTVSVSAVSHQLRELRHARLVDSRREGKHVIYFLADDHVRTILEQGAEHVNEKFKEAVS